MQSPEQMASQQAHSCTKRPEADVVDSITAGSRAFEFFSYRAKESAQLGSSGSMRCTTPFRQRELNSDPAGSSCSHHAGAQPVDAMPMPMPISIRCALCAAVAPVALERTVAPRTDLSFADFV